MMGYVKIVVIALLAIIGVLLVVQNLESLTQVTTLRLNLYVWHGQTDAYPIYLIILLAFLVGIFLASLLGFCDRIRIRRNIKEMERQKAELHKEIASLRKLSYDIAAHPHSGDKND